MKNQTPNKVKKMFVVLLAVLFVASITATAVSAADYDHHDHENDHYNHDYDHHDHENDHHENDHHDHDYDNHDHDYDHHGHR